MTLDTDKLSAPLDASRVKTRAGGRGAALSYLETHDVIRTANDIFGFGRWGHEVVDLRQVASVAVHNQSGTAGVCVGYICTVRLTVEGCVPVSGVGYGDATEYRESAAVTAHELAVKEAESDALKRALKNYGDQFGLALYDKDAARAGHITASATATRQVSAPQQRSTAQRREGAAVPSGPPADDPGEWRWPLGKHQGERLADTPSGYIDWYLLNGHSESIQEILKRYRAVELDVSGNQYKDHV